MQFDDRQAGRQVPNPLFGQRHGSALDKRGSSGCQFLDAEDHRVTEHGVGRHFIVPGGGQLLASPEEQLVGEDVTHGIEDGEADDVVRLSHFALEGVASNVV